MSISALLNLGSLLLGLIAWIFPVLFMKRFAKYGIKKCNYSIIMSFGACLVSLCLQFFKINRLVEIEDWSAVMDTIGTLKWVAVFLAVITLTLNIFTLFICYDKEEMHDKTR